MFPQEESIANLVHQELVVVNLVTNIPSSLKVNVRISEVLTQQHVMLESISRQILNFLFALIAR